MKFFELMRSDLSKETAAQPKPVEQPEEEEQGNWEWDSEPEIKPEWMPSPFSHKKAQQPEAGIGLTSKDAARRLAQHGPNHLHSDQKIHPFQILIAQFKDVLVVILLISTVASALLGDMTEAIAIGIIVVLNGLIGFFQEYRTEKTLKALKKMSAPTAKVYRDGALVHIPTEELVSGDVIELEAGDKVPADATLLSAIALQADEAILTGESVPVEKTVSDDETLGQVNMGTIVTARRGQAEVNATGMKTKMGTIADMLSQIEDGPTPLQKRLDELGKFIGIGCLVVCVIVTAAGVLRGENLLDMLITGVSLAVAVVPEGLAAIVTITLALAVKRMVRRNALIRRIYAVETLGCASVICTDKTGTLTENRMTVQRIATLRNDYECREDRGGERALMAEGQKANLKKDTALQQLLECCVLCNNAALPEGREAYGDPTEIALLRAAKIGGVTTESTSDNYVKQSENPFDSVKKYMTVTVRKMGGKRFLFAKGAVDVLLDHCSMVQDGTAATVLSRSQRQEILKKNEAFAGHALRVIGFAVRELTAGDNEKDTELTFLGMAGMIDPPRKEVKGAIRQCNKAGIKVAMITGDHQATAVAIAGQIGIYHRGDNILTGKELEAMTDRKLDKVVCGTTVFARVSPSHKLRIVRSLKRHGHVVAMTGDGVNDAPAIKEADIGVSMGITGSDVTKEASELILLDDNFATLVSTVEEGRTIYGNIRKFIRYLLSCNIGEVLTMFAGILMGLPVVLLPIQILLVNLVTDGLPAISLGMEPAEDNVMQRKPRRKTASVFADGLLSKIVFRGCLIGLTTLAVFVTVFRQTGGVEIARTAAFFTLVLTQLLHVFECKSETKSIFSVPHFNNPMLVFSVLASLGIVLCAIYLPALQPLFSTVSLAWQQILTVLAYSFAVPVISAIGHVFMRNPK